MARENCVRAKCEYLNEDMCNDLAVPAAQVTWCGIWFDDPDWEWYEKLVNVINPEEIGGK